MEREKFLEKLKKHGEANDIPNISKKNASFLRDMLAKNNVKQLLEIGSAN